MSVAPMGERRGLRRRLEFTLVGVALFSVLLLSILNYAFARVLLTDSVESQLVTLRDSRVQTLERGAERLQADVSNLAVTPSVIAALEELSAGYLALDTEDLIESADLVAAYEDVVEPLGVDISEVLPESAAGRRVQDLYIVNNPNAYEDRDLLDDAGDGSDYSAAHAEYHPLLRSLMQNVRMSDLLLVDAETTEVVYSVMKRVDIGTSATAGPWSADALGRVIDALSGAAIGDTVIVDSSFYPPARGQAVLFMASAIRSGSDVVGAVITEVPVAGITELMTAGQDWQLLGLGDTGEVYVVGEDGTLRTEVRQWIDDPERFLIDFSGRSDASDTGDQIESFGSPVLLQSIDNAAIDAALAGEEFLGNIDNYRGVATLTAAAPAQVASLDWVVVVEQARSETTRSLTSMLRGTVLVMAILLPVTAVLGWWMARSLTRPFESLVRSAADVAKGEPIVGVDQLGNNEIGDVGRQLELVAVQLEAEEQAIVAEEKRITDVLGAVLPERLVDRVRRGEQSITDLVDTATVISIVVGGLPEATGSDQDTVLEITEQIGDELDRLMGMHGIERLRRSASNELFVAGLGQDDANVGGAVAFATALPAMLSDIGSEYGHDVVARIGVAAGEVATGVIGRSQLTFSVWGEAVSQAFSLSSLASPGDVLVDGDVADELDGTWQVDECVDLAGLDDRLHAFRVTRAGTAPLS